MIGNRKDNKIGTIYCNLDTRDIYIKPEEKKYFQGIDIVINICPKCLELASIQKSIKRTIFKTIKEINYKCEKCGFEHTIK